MPILHWLSDRHIFVIEFKGAHLLADAQEKKNIGELWEAKSEGKALYLMAVKPDGNGEVYRQIEEKLK
jgi:type III restriction enzyme